MEEERNTIPSLIGVEDNIDKEERDNILELLKRPWSRDGRRLKDASKNIKGDGEIVMMVPRLARAVTWPVPAPRARARARLPRVLSAGPPSLSLRLL